MKTKHDGDCYFYSKSKICTCGFLSQLARMPDSKEFEDNEKEILIHEINLECIAEINREKRRNR